MRTYRKIPVEIDECTSVTCNKCGKPVGPQAEEFDNHLNVSYMGGYASELGDCVQYRFDLCEGCLKEFMDSFAIKAEIGDEYGFGADDEVPADEDSKGVDQSG
jgi:hypothetical protein